MEILKKHRLTGNSSAPSYKEHTQKQCDILNATPGVLPAYDCKICKNKGVIYFVGPDDEILTKPCSCMGIRNSIMRINNSGLKSLLDICTFESFKTETPLQEKIKNTAWQFVKNNTDNWFFIGGQSGVGKTHICTAICGELLKHEEAVRYMLWNDESAKIKAAVNDEDEYAKLLNPLKSVQVLYIDDLFKPIIDDRGMRKQPNPGDIRLAFELINSRYISPSLITIISSEWTLSELQRIDPAIGGRVYQRAKDFCLSISRGEEKNYRLK